MRQTRLPRTAWPSVFGGPAWTRVTEPDGKPGQWYLHLFAPGQPDLNWAHPEVVVDFEQTLRFWLDRGVDGFRLVAHGMAKPDGLPDLAWPKRASSPRNCAPRSRNSLAAVEPVSAVPTWTLSNHDIEREVTRYGGDPVGVALARAMILVALALPGVVFVYNGAELGLPGCLMC